MSAAVPSFALGLTGFPLSHSRSPLIHNTALQALGLPGEYRLYPVPPMPEGRAELRALLDEVRQGRLHGLNVTIPHKQAVLAEMDELTPTARAIGAVNTIYLQDGRLWGDNTDAPGFLADLANHLTPPDAPRALVLGAGGSARAVVHALAQNWQVSGAARRLEQAEGLRSLGARDAVVLSASELADAGPFDLLVNTTPLGMHPNTAECAWPDELPFISAGFVYDLVYNPARTLLMQRAAQQGIPSTNGLGMLVEQAALAFERWTGRSAPRPAILAALS